MSSSPLQHRIHGQYRSSLSPTSSCTDDESEPSQHSQPNDLTTSGRSKHTTGCGSGENGGGQAHSRTFPGYSSFYSPNHHSSSLGQGSHGSVQSGGDSGGSPYIATNEYRIIEYRGARIAAFLSANRTPCEYLLCLPQAFELFLKHLVGGLHTVYTKLKRLDIVPIVCNVEQVRILRGIGAIQPGVNRCKLLSTKDFDVLYKDCTTARPGRPPKRSPVAGMVSPGPTAINPTTPTQPSNAVPYLGFPPTGKKPRFAEEAEFGNDSMDLKQQGKNGSGSSNNCAATAAAMLAANGYSAFPFLQHFTAATTSTQQQQLVAAAAALGLPGLPSARSSSESPLNSGFSPMEPTTHSSRGNNGTNNSNDHVSPLINDLTDPLTAYSFISQIFRESITPSSVLWQISQHQQQSSQQQSSSAANAALNLSRANSTNGTGNGTSGSGGGGGAEDRGNSGSNLANNMDKLSVNNSNAGNHGSNHTSKSPLNNGNQATGERDESTDDEDDDEDVESNNSSNNSENPVSSTGFNGLSSVMRSISDGNHNNHNPSSDSPPPLTQSSQHHQNTIGFSTGASLVNPLTSSQQAHHPSLPQAEHCLETLLKNIEGLLAIAAHNARQQQSQLHLQKAELKAELGAQIVRERELKEQLEKQLNEEQKIRNFWQRRFKKERRFRRKVEQDLQHLQDLQKQLQNQQKPSSKSPSPPPNPPFSVAGPHGNNQSQESTGEVSME